MEGSGIERTRGIGRVVGDGRATLREKHLAAVLQLALTGDGTTRADVARSTGLARATVSSLVSELISLGYLRNGPTLTSTGGKPAQRIQASPGTHGVLAVLVSRNELRAAVYDLTGRRFTEEHREFDRPVRVSDIAKLCALMTSRSVLTLRAVAVEIPGVVTADGTVLDSVQLGWHDMPISGPIEAAAGLPVHLINDADAESFAELIGSADSDRSFLYLHLGVGVGGAVVQSSQLMTGRTSRIGELGHVRIDFAEDAPECRCGARGCVEAVVSLATVLGDDREVAGPPERIRLLARRAPVRARSARAAAQLARLLPAVCAIIDLPEVVIGGPASALGEEFLDNLRTELDRYPAAGARPVQVGYAKIGDPYLGAAGHALLQELGVRWIPSAC